MDQNDIMKIKPAKTKDTTGTEVVFDLSVCPMVQEDLARIPADKRSGPVVVDGTGTPCRDGRRQIRGIEGDRQKLAGHAREEMTDNYDADMIEAHCRVMASRTSFRKNGK